MPDCLCPNCGISRTVTRDRGPRRCRDCYRASAKPKDDFEITVDVPKTEYHPNQAKEDLLQTLVKLTGRHPLPFEEVCNKLDLAPAKLKALLERAEQLGSLVGVTGNQVGFKPSPDDHIIQTGIAPVSGERSIVAHITDTHLGSKYCLRSYLKDFIHYAYSKGVREILHTGDIVDGRYHHAAYEMSHHGLNDQTQDLYETLPRLEGLTYHAIAGNHDFTFTAESGIDVPAFISNYFRERGRNDFFGYGARGAFLNVRGAIFHLWHPGGGVPYALTYGLQKKCEGYSPGFKPHFLLAGHWHTHVVADIRGIYCVAGGTFQGGQSAFAKSLKSGAPAIGGGILSWGQTADGTIRSFIHERLRYFEKEDLQEVGNAILGRHNGSL